MQTHENTLSERERFILGALASDDDAATSRRAHALLEWSHGTPREKIVQLTGLRPSQIQYLTRTFAQKRLEVFALSSVERASRGLAGHTTLDALLQQYHVDLAHARHVGALATQIFDQTSALHELSAEWRHLLELGALLHNIGARGDEDSHHHRVGRDIVLNHDIEGISPRDRDVLACLALFHTKKAKPTHDAIFVGLDEATQHATLVVASILRIADGLDYSQTQSTTLKSIHVNAVVDALVEGPNAVDDAARANKKADLWRRVLTPPFYARLENEELPSPESLKRKSRRAVRGHETITQAGKKIFAEQFAKLQAMEDDVRAGKDIDAVHDMRVASRRLRSAFRLLGKYYSIKRVKKIRTTLREVAGDLGDVRDLDVLIENLRAYTSTLTVEQQRALDPLLADWQTRRADAHRQLVDLLDSAAYDSWIARVEDFIDAKDRADAPRVADVVPGLIWKRYGAVREYEPRVKHASLQTLHALRIESKRLRYALEFFEESLGTQAAALIEPMVALQDHLGALHDADVATQLVAEFIAGRARYAQRHGSQVTNLETVAAYLTALQSRIVELQTGVPERWQVVVRAPYRQALAEAVAAL